MVGYAQINDLLAAMNKAKPCDKKLHGFSFVKVCDRCLITRCMECADRRCQCESKD